MGNAQLCPERGNIGSAIASAPIIGYTDSRLALRAESRRSQRMLNVLESGTVMLEAKDGAYRPREEDDIMGE